MSTTFKLPDTLEALNELVQNYGNSAIKTLGYSALFGGIDRRVSHTEFRIVHAVFSRTVRFGKLCEQITEEEMRSGKRDGKGELLCDKRTGLPLFTGVGIKNIDETFRPARSRAEAKGLITTWRKSVGRGRQTYVYMFATPWWWWNCVDSFAPAHASVDWMEELHRLLQAASEEAGKNWDDPGAVQCITTDNPSYSESVDRTALDPEYAD